MRRNKHEGTISRMANGRLRMRVMVGGTSHSKVADTKAELARWRRDLMMQIDSGVHPQATKMTVAEAFSMWFEEYQKTVRSTTRQNFKSSIAMWARELADIRVTQLNREMIQEIVDAAMASGYAGTTIGNRVVILGMMCQWCVDHGYILRKPNIGVKVTRTQSKVDPRVVEYAERIIEHFEANNPLMAARCRLLFHTGLRVGEACGLMWSDVDFRSNRITVSRQYTRSRLGPPKTSSSYRTLTLADSTMQVLEALASSCPYLYVISTSDKPVDSNVVSMQVAKAANKLGIKFKTHWFRHAHASYALHHGMNIAALSARLGHSSIKTTLDIYSHMIPGADEVVREMWKVKTVVQKSG